MTSPAPGRIGLLPVLAALAIAGGACARGDDTVFDQTGVTMVAVGGGTPLGGLPADSLPGGPVGSGTAVAPESPLQTAEPAARAPASGPPLIDPAIVALMAEVDPERLTADIAHLVGFGTRHALSVPDLKDRGVGAARDWIHGRLDSFGGAANRQIVVEYEDFELTLGGHRTTQRNVIATLPGRDRPKRFVYVAAHYDSRTADIDDGGSVAPGADDNASGVATLLETARILSRREWAAGIRFVALAAEEPGLRGSRHHAKGAKAVGLPILAVLHNEVVGGAAGPDGIVDASHFSIYSAGADEDASRGLARYVALMAERYAGPAPTVEPVADPPERESSHRSFDDEGFAAVRIASGTQDETRQHNELDTQDRLDPEYHAALTRLNVVVAATLAQAPPPVAEAPSVREVAGTLAITWQPVQHPAVAGYWVALRREGQARYTSWRWVGAAALAGEAAGGVSVVGPGEPLTATLDPGPEGIAGVRVVVATAGDGGHMSLFSPEGEH